MKINLMNSNTNSTQFPDPLVTLKHTLNIYRKFPSLFEDARIVQKYFEKFKTKKESSILDGMNLLIETKNLVHKFKCIPYSKVINLSEINEKEDSSLYKKLSEFTTLTDQIEILKKKIPKSWNSNKIYSNSKDLTLEDILKALAFDTLRDLVYKSQIILIEENETVVTELMKRMSIIGDNEEFWDSIILKVREWSKSKDIVRLEIFTDNFDSFLSSCDLYQMKKYRKKFVKLSNKVFEVDLAATSPICVQINKVFEHIKIFLSRTDLDVVQNALKYFSYCEQKIAENQIKKELHKIELDDKQIEDIQKKIFEVIPQKIYTFPLSHFENSTFGLTLPNGDLVLDDRLISDLDTAKPFAQIFIVLLHELVHKFKLIYLADWNAKNNESDTILLQIYEPGLSFSSVEAKNDHLSKFTNNLDTGDLFEIFTFGRRYDIQNLTIQVASYINNPGKWTNQNWEDLIKNSKVSSEKEKKCFEDEDSPEKNDTIKKFKTPPKCDMVNISLDPSKIRKRKLKRGQMIATLEELMENPEKNAEAIEDLSNQLYRMAQVYK